MTMMTYGEQQREAPADVTSMTDTEWTAFYLELERESNDPHTHQCSGCGRAWQHMEPGCEAPVYPMHCRRCPS